MLPPIDKLPNLVVDEVFNFTLTAKDQYDSIVMFTIIIDNNEWFDQLDIVPQYSINQENKETENFQVVISNVGLLDTSFVKDQLVYFSITNIIAQEYTVMIQLRTESGMETFRSFSAKILPGITLIIFYNYVFIDSFHHVGPAFVNLSTVDYFPPYTTIEKEDLLTITARDKYNNLVYNNTSSYINIAFDPDEYDKSLISDFNNGTLVYSVSTIKSKNFTLTIKIGADDLHGSSYPVSVAPGNIFTFFFFVVVITFIDVDLGAPITYIGRNPNPTGDVVGKNYTLSYEAKDKFANPVPQYIIESSRSIDMTVSFSSPDIRYSLAMGPEGQLVVTYLHC